jgi:hypothetical protein
MPTKATLFYIIDRYLDEIYIMLRSNMFIFAILTDY